jgi:DNA-binding CsgD family transcriptional regulator
VLALVYQDVAIKDISEQLQVSESVVKGTLQQLFQKTGSQTRNQLVRVALDHYKDQM